MNGDKRTPKVGDRVRYPGDVCNHPAVCVVTAVSEDRWGKWFSAKEEPGPLSFDREFPRMTFNSFVPGPLGGAPWTFVE